MTVSAHIGRHRGEVREALEFTRTTVIGGALFLLPIFVVLLVLGKVLDLMQGLTKPLVEAVGVTSIGGIAVGDLVTILAILLASFFAGLFARTESGQAALAWMRQGVAAVIPQFSLIQDVAQKLGTGDDAAEMPVVLVPVESGWALGLLLHAAGDWHAVFIPDAPQMSSGSVAYAHRDHIHRTDLTLPQLWVLLRGRGKGSSTVLEHLTRLQAAGKIERASEG
jgi:uncharacterized membrane protein